MVSCVLGNVGRFGLKFLKVKDCGLGEFWMYGGGWSGFIYGLIIGEGFIMGFLGIVFYLYGIVIEEL